MRAKRFRVSPELIREALHLPESSIIRALQEDPSSPDLNWWIVVEHESFEEVPEGSRPFESAPTVTIQHYTCGHEERELEWQ